MPKNESSFLCLNPQIEGLLEPGPTAAVAGNSQAVRPLSAPGISLDSATAATTEPDAAPLSNQQPQLPESPTGSSSSKPPRAAAQAPLGSSTVKPADADGSRQAGSAGTGLTRPPGGVFRGAVRVLAAQVSEPVFADSEVDDDNASSSPQHSRVSARRQQGLDSHSRDNSDPAAPDTMRREPPNPEQPQLNDSAQPLEYYWEAPRDSAAHSWNASAAAGAAASADSAAAAEPRRPLNCQTAAAEGGPRHDAGQQDPAQQQSTNGSAAQNLIAASAPPPADVGTQQAAPAAAATIAAPGGKRRPLRRAQPATKTLDLPLAGLEPQPMRKVKFRRRGGRRVNKRLRLLVRDSAGAAWQTSTGIAE